MGGEWFQNEPYENLAYWDMIDFGQQIDHPRRTRDNVNAHELPMTSVRAYSRFRDVQRKVHPDGHYAAQYMLFTSQPHVYRAVLEEDPYPIKAIIVQNGEPLVNYGGAKLGHKAFTSDKLDLLVVMDHWQTPTAQLADYILPATDCLERGELSMRWGFTRMFSVGQACVEPTHERRDDYDLWAALGRRLLDPADWPENVEGALDMFLAPSGKSYREWAEGPGPNCYLPQSTRSRKYLEHGFATQSGKVELIPGFLAEFGIDPRPVYTGPPFARPDVDDEDRYPLQMLTGSRVLEFQGSTMRQSAKMLARHPEPLVEMHPDTAAQHGIADGDWVEISRPEGAIRQKAKVTGNILPGTINLAGYWWDPTRGPTRDLSGVWEANGNAIVPDDPKLSSYVGDQPLRGMRCRIDKVEVPA
jgi:anaerobic selenocysteine-containing dehydrogenase